MKLEKRQLIVKVAIKLFEKFWFKKVSVDQIVKDSWIAKWTFYIYFKTKDQLYEEILDTYFKKAIFYMDDLSVKISNIKQRLYYKMIWSLLFVERFPIVRNLALWNTDYFSTLINQKTLRERHKKMMKHLLKWLNVKKEFNWIVDDDFLERMMSFYVMMLPFRNRFDTQKDFYDFASRYVKILINWLYVEKFDDFEVLDIIVLQDIIKKEKSLSLNIWKS